MSFRNMFFAVVAVVCSGRIGFAQWEKLGWFPRDSFQSPVMVRLMGADHRSIGTATISGGKRLGVTVAMDVMNLPPGGHSLGFDKSAKCEALRLISAGGISNTGGNFTVKADGTARVKI